MVTNVVASELDFLWLEITGRCNLTCTHCYAESAPQGNHGAMQCADWERVIAEARMLGCQSVQFIGGEPTVYPFLPRLVRYASHLQMSIEVYTNLVSIKSAHWDVFQECQVSIATSFYSSNAEIHEEITAGHGSFAKTVKNIEQVQALGLPLRVGLVAMRPDQDIDETKKFLAGLGVYRVSVDHIRSVGRGSQRIQVSGKREDALCGHCARRRAAVTPSGDVYPCVFSRWLPVGNVLQGSLKDIVNGQALWVTRQELQVYFDGRRVVDNAENCMPRTESYMVTQRLPGREEDDECPPELACKPTSECLPDWEPCNPEKYPPCPPDKEACPPDWDPKE